MTVAVAAGGLDVAAAAAVAVAAAPAASGKPGFSGTVNSRGGTLVLGYSLFSARRFARMSGSEIGTARPQRRIVPGSRALRRGKVSGVSCTGRRARGYQSALLGSLDREGCARHVCGSHLLQRRGRRGWLAVLAYICGTVSKV